MTRKKIVLKKTARRCGVDIEDLDSRKNPKGGGTADAGLAAKIDTPGAGGNPLGLNFEEIKLCSRRDPK